MQKISRFAPTPSGRMHLGNLFAALLVWLDARSTGGTLVFRVEDLDPERCSRERAAQMAEDLRWLGLDWDLGGVEPAYCQSCRGEIYREAFQRLKDMGLIYPCYCTRSERLAASAPHGLDGLAVYSGKCAQLTEEERDCWEKLGRRPAWRIRVPEETIRLTDGHLGPVQQNLRRDCGDYILRRSDGVWAYQLAVVADDIQMGVNRVVRGGDLLSSAPRQSWLTRLLGGEPPEYFHFPLLITGEGKKLSKRDGDLDLGRLREICTPETVTGLLAWWAGILPEPEPIRAADLIDQFSWDRIPIQNITVSVPDRFGNLSGILRDAGEKKKEGNLC